MYIRIDQTDYAKHRNLSFAPQTDFTGNTVPINEFSIEIITTDTIAYGQYAYLYDDLNNLWAKYWIVYAERTGADAVLVRARSDISLLDGVTLPAVMYSGAAIVDVLDDTMVRQSSASGIVAAIDYTLDSSFDSVTITGFCPEQTARERLQWVCFVIGAYVKSFFNDEIEILPIDGTTTLVPVDRTFFKPTVNYSDYVTGIKVIGYTFTQGTPGVTDEYVTDGTDYYIVTKQEYTLANSAAPSGAVDNIVTIVGVYLVNSGNVSGILTHLSGLYFKRTEIQADVIDNAEYIPGDKLTVYADVDTMFTGYARLCEFAFGKQAKAKITLTAGESMDGAKLTVTYMYGDMNIGRAEYFLPVGYAYSITNPYVDWSMNGHRYIFRPTTAAVSGTMTSSGATATVNYAVALDETEEILQIVSVDSVTVDSNGVAVIT